MSLDKLTFHLASKVLFPHPDNKTVSQYKQEYPERPLDINPVSQNPRGNFSIGADNPLLGDNTYLSQFKHKYPQHPTAKRAPIKDADQQNIVLGFDPNSNQTNYKDEFIKKATDKAEKVDQRVVSVELGDTLTDFTTSYKNTYTGTQAPPTQQANSGLGKNNLVLGYDSNPYVTSSQQYLDHKNIAATKALPRNYHNNISLGSDPVPYQS